MPLSLLTVAFPLALLTIACSLLATERDDARGRRVLTIGRVAWVALALVGAGMAWSVFPRFEPVLASVHLPMLGLFAGSGLLTGGSAAAQARRPLGRALPAALLAFAALGLLPLYLFQVVGDPDPPPRATGAPLAALVETARYGFGGPVPTSMEPEVQPQLERGLGHPPREVTVTMGSTGVAAAAIALLCALAAVARLLPAPGARSSVLTVGPLAVLLAALLVRPLWLTPGEALWRNEPAIVRAYGPWLLAAAIAPAALAAVAAVLGRRDSRRAATAGRTASSRSRP